MLKVTKSRGNRKLIIDGQKENAGKYMSETLLKTRTIRASWSTTRPRRRRFGEGIGQVLLYPYNSDEECIREIERDMVD